MARERLIEASLRTDQGRVRNNNQDFVAWREPETVEDARRDGWLYILADGAGGMDAGEVASRFATERTLHHYMEGGEERDWSRRLFDAMQAANSDLRELCAREDGNNRMATTMVATVLHDGQATIANVGDSRAYLWRKGKLRQITKDQSLVARLLDEGAITAEEAANHPRRNVILYSLGSERTPRIDLFELALQPGDKLLVCSDGLTRHVDDEEMGMVLAESAPAEATETLISLANERGGQDNISVGVVALRDKSKEDAPRVVPTPPAAEEPQEAPALSRRARVFLWIYTLLLSVAQSAAIVALWLFL
ncbi:MAG: Stp1/IreP family PP2C-type Ser/Thr phosphatase [Chloroflexota bacterium]